MTMSEATPAPVETKGRLYRPEFPDHWQRRPLHSLAKWVNGLAFRDIHFTPTGRPVIKIAEIKGGISAQTKFTEQMFDDSVHVQPGDLLFSWSGQPETSIDAFWWRGPEGWLNQHVFRVTPAEDIDKTFLFYLLRYLNPLFIEIARNKQTTGLGHVTRRDLENIEAAYPELPEQRAIAHILGSLDDKIELNRRMSETLEEIARAIFKSWFVDFDPVPAKAGGDEKHLPAEVVDLFPSKLVESPAGPAPDGWEVTPLGEHVEVMRGLSYHGAELAEEGMPLHNLNSVLEGGGYKYEGLKRYVGKYQERHLVEPGDVIVANTEQGHKYLLIGYPALVPRVFGAAGIFSADLFRVRPQAQSPLTRRFVYLLLLTPRLHDEVVAYTQGTTVNHLSMDGLRQPLVVVPPAELVGAFERLAAPLLEESERLVAESRALAELRDALLPKLISGELRVKDAEQFVERVGT